MDLGFVTRPLISSLDRATSDDVGIGRMPSFISGLKTAAVSPYAFAAYILLVCAWVYVTIAQSRLAAISKVITQVPESERGNLLENEYRTFPRSGLTPEQWIRSRKANLVAIVIIAIILAFSAIVIIYIVENGNKRRDADLTPTDWQMNLHMFAAVIKDENGGIVGQKICDVESRSKDSIKDPIQLTRGHKYRLSILLELIVDNVYRTHKDLIYPIGLANTWDKSISTIYDGRGVKAARAVDGGPFQKTFTYETEIITPSNTGSQYILVSSGAMINARQIFYESENEELGSNSIWNRRFDEFKNDVCVGNIDGTFMHNDGRQERVEVPTFSIPVDIV